MKKLFMSFLFIFAMGFVFLSTTNSTSAAPVDDSIQPLGLPDLTPIEGAYIKTNVYANGGRVNIDYQYYFMNARAGAQFASKIEPSLAEAVGWFGASFIPGAGPYLGTIGFISTSQRTVTATNIRKHTDQGKSVLVIYSRDNFYGIHATSVLAWDGRIGTVYAGRMSSSEKYVTTQYNY